jgi:hypothetical protein
VDYDIDPDERVSMAVVRAVSAVDGRIPESLPPLAERIDPGALDAVFAASSDGSPPTRIVCTDIPVPTWTHTFTASLPR